jgi:radical SAM protein with 4Fe4S-binding SPASM domain
VNPYRRFLDYRQRRRRQRNIDAFRKDIFNPQVCARSMPLNVYYEPTSYCNLKCKICYRETSDGFADNQHMADEVFERIHPTFADALTVMILGYGEPLIYPKLDQHLKRCKESGVNGMISTNGVLVSDKMVEVLLSGGLAMLNFSLDASTTETYRAIRGTGDFEKVVANYKKLSEEKQRRGLDLPVLSVSFCLLRENREDYGVFAQLAADMGAEHLLTQRFEADAQFEGHRDLTLETAEMDSLIENARAECATRGFTFHLNHFNHPPDLSHVDVTRELVAGWKEEPYRGKPMFFCDSLWRMFGVKYDGRVFPCCPRLNTIVGDLKEQTASQVWNGPAYRRLRWELLSGNYPEICASCPERRSFDPEGYDGELMDWVNNYMALASRII